MFDETSHPISLKIVTLVHIFKNIDWIYILFIQKIQMETLAKSGEQTEFKQPQLDVPHSKPAGFTAVSSHLQMKIPSPEVDAKQRVSNSKLIFKLIRYV